MENVKKSVIIVDGYSTGAFYLPILKERGYAIFHVRSTPQFLKSHITEVADTALERWGKYYSALYDGTVSIEQLCEELKKLSPVAVIPGCETGVELADLLADRLGLPGNCLDLSSARRDKYLMQKALQREGKRFLESGLCKDTGELQGFMKKLGKFPVVIKPVKSSGADGVHICSTAEETLQAFQSLIGSLTFLGDIVDQVLVQEFARGEEIVVNTVSSGGLQRVTDLWRYRKNITSKGRSVYEGVELVPDFEEKAVATRNTRFTDEILAYAFSVLDALKINIGAAHLEIMITSEGPVLIECGARVMGGSFSQELLRECLGYTQIEASLDSYLSPDDFRLKWDKPYSPKKYSIFKYLVSERGGAMDAIPGISLLASLSSVRGGNFITSLENGHIEPTIDLQSSPASIFLCHEDRSILNHDYSLINELEEEAQSLLFEMSPLQKGDFDPEWFKLLPDYLWLKPEEAGEPDAKTIWKALNLSEGMEILDCPCGDGRVGIHLARGGVKITGVDLNSRFIEKAKKRFSDEGIEAEFIVSDMRDLTFKNRFDAIVNWFNSFGYFDIETDFYVLKLFRKCLKPGGLILIEAPNRSNIIANTRKLIQNDGSEAVRNWDELTERIYVPIESENEGKHVKFAVGTRMYSQAQYKLLFRLAGLETVSVYDEKLDPFTEDSKRMIFIVKKV